MEKKIFAKEELIGLPVNIHNCMDPNWNNKKGIIIDETKNTFLIKYKNKIKRIAKNIAIFEFENNKNKYYLNGSKILYKPEERIKKTR
jgi:ribonuclease P protein subunit POP4